MTATRATSGAYARTAELSSRSFMQLVQLLPRRAPSGLERFRIPPREASACLVGGLEKREERFARATCGTHRLVGQKGERAASRVNPFAEGEGLLAEASRLRCRVRVVVGVGDVV